MLKINNFQNFTGSKLGDFSNLKELHCRYCSNLEDKFLIRTLRCAPKLEFIDVRFCYKITSAVVNFAVEETKKRQNNIVLEMCIGGTDIRYGDITDISPLLILNNSWFQ